MTEEAKIAGLFDHGTTVGTAREFIVGRCLRSFLPAGVEIGSGEVVDSNGNRSKQIDVVVYDSRFPALRTGAGALYLIEGVIATIEVKSTMKPERLRESLDNCVSVSMLLPKGREESEKTAYLKRLMELRNCDDKEAEHHFWLQMLPATYIYAFRSELSLEATVDVFKDWAGKLRGSRSAIHRGFPRVTTCGRDSVVSNDGLLKFVFTENAQPDLFGFRSKHRFRWFAIHLFERVASRLGMQHGATRCDYEIRSHIPAELLKPDGPLLGITIGGIA